MEAGSIIAASVNRNTNKVTPSRMDKRAQYVALLGADWPSRAKQQDSGAYSSLKVAVATEMGRPNTIAYLMLT